MVGALQEILPSHPEYGAHHHEQDDRLNRRERKYRRMRDERPNHRHRQQRGTDCGQSRHEQQHRADDFNGSRRVPEPLTEPDCAEQLHHHRCVAQLVEAGQKKLGCGQYLERPHQLADGQRELPPAFRGVVDLRVTPFEGLVDALGAASLSSFLLRSRSAAARRRPATPFACGFAPSAGSASVLALGLKVLLPTSSTCADFCTIAFAEPDAQEARVAARPRREPRRDGVEQLRDDLAVLHVLHDQASGSEDADFARRASTLGGAIGEAALGHCDDPLDERPQLLRLRHRRCQVLMEQERCRLVPQHRDGGAGDPAQLSGVRLGVS